MRNLKFHDNATNTNWVQVQKRTAEKLYNKGEDLIFCPCNFVPFGHLSCGHLIDTKRYLEEQVEFSSAVYSFEYYNCGPEQGMYTTFYKKHRIQPIHVLFSC